jgi:hypothetical protein
MERMDCHYWPDVQYLNKPQVQCLSSDHEYAATLFAQFTGSQLHFRDRDAFILREWRFWEEI